ncbi:ATP/GTP-binding protein [Streptomyces violaceusniger]|uniref:ATP/GTP-binding protein n=1 Tax=Streptomyces violaceusniger TaxID=68280 RepID=UPI003434D1B4
MLRIGRAAAATAALAAVLAPLDAYADDGPTVGNDDACRGSVVAVTVCAKDVSGAPGKGGAKQRQAAARKGGGKSAAPKCTYSKLKPQPPAGSPQWEGHKPGDKGAVYQVLCPDTQRIGTLWVPAGGAPAAPAVDPEVLAQRAVDAMKLVGPDIASPRPAGKYVVGMPMWMWVEKGPTTFGPNSAKAAAGGVTVTATAEVSSVRWAMGDGTTVTCTGPGTRYTASRGRADSPDCGHRYRATSAGERGGRYHGTATATWSVNWQVAGTGGESGQFTETRQTPFTVGVREVQVLN